MKKNFEDLELIPPHEYQEYQLLLAKSKAAWEYAKTHNDYAHFAPVLKEIIAYGKPTTYKQTQDNGKVINSRSSIMRYIPADNQIILIGKATIFQENSHVNGEKIVYNTVTKQLKATNGNAQNGRVQSTFVPNELKNKKAD